MEVIQSGGDNALSTVGPRPMEWSTVPYGAPQGPGPNGKQRTSSLESPIMLLSGHQSTIYTMKFNPAGTVVASGSHDREIFLWNVHGDCKNFMVLKGHKNAVLDLHWTTDGSQIISASPDKTLRAWDVETGKQIKKMAEHSSFVNSCCPSRRGPPLVVSDLTMELLNCGICVRGVPFKRFQINTKSQLSVSQMHLIRSSLVVLTMK